MEQKTHSLKTDKLEKSHAQFGLLGIIISMGIVYGDIGTSPLYVMNALIDGTRLTHNFIVGAISCVIWTLTLQTTIKYVLITLKADNNGEGGIFSLYALLRKKKKNVYVFAIIGGATFLANGVLTPSITVTSAIEGLKSFNPELSVIPIVIAIFVVLFFSQQFGTKNLGKSFGPIMLIWFSVLGILGSLQIINYPAILEAFNPTMFMCFSVNFLKGFYFLELFFFAQLAPKRCIPI